MDEVGLIRIHARENATQRGNSGSQVGTGAAALRYLANQALTGGAISNVGNPTVEFEKHGIGFRPILDFLVNIPGVNENTRFASGNRNAEIICRRRDRRRGQGGAGLG